MDRSGKKIRTCISATGISKPLPVQPVLGWTVLHSSKEAGALRLLIAAGADVNARDVANRTPIFYQKSTEAIEACIEAGADVNAKDNRNRTPIFHLDNAKSIKVCIEAGADVNARDKEGTTPLHMDMDRASVQVLLDHGAKIFDEEGKPIVDNNGHTVLHCPRKVGVVPLLLAKAKAAGAEKLAALVEARDKNGHGALSYALS
jgi:ankyrin repeat protein